MYPGEGFRHQVLSTIGHRSHAPLPQGDHYQCDWPQHVRAVAAPTAYHCSPPVRCRPDGPPLLVCCRSDGTSLLSACAIASYSCRPVGTLVRSARQLGSSCICRPGGIRRHISTQQLVRCRPDGTSLRTACANTFAQWPPRRHSPALPLSIHKSDPICHATPVAGRLELTSRTTTQRYQWPPPFYR